MPRLAAYYFACGMQPYILKAELGEYAIATHAIKDHLQPR